MKNEHLTAIRVHLARTDGDLVLLDRDDVEWLLSAYDMALLSPRQREIYPLYREGVTYTEIAERLNISERTAKDHCVQIRRTLGLPPRQPGRRKKGGQA